MLSFSQLVDEVAVVLGTARRPDDSLRTSVKRWVNQACRVIAYSYPWWTRQAQQTVVTVAPYETGTVTFTESSATVTGSGTTFTSAMVGRKIARSLGGPFYRISAYSSATSITISEAYREDTVSGASYTIFQDEYDLAATTHSVEDVELYRDRALGPVLPVPEYELDAVDYPGSVTGYPSKMCLCTSTTQGTPRVRLSAVPDDVYRLRIKYTPTWVDLKDDGVPNLPDECEELIVDRALRNAPKIEGSRRIMPDAEWRKALSAAYALSRPVKNLVSRRVGFGSYAGTPRLIVNMGGIVQ